MAKNNLSFTCTNCAQVSLKWLGCCPSCNEWHSFEETKTAPVFFSNNTGNTGSKPNSRLSSSLSSTPGSVLTMYALENISLTTHPRLLSGINEWDTVMGGGIMPGSLLVLTGDPGIGKSTLLLHVAYKLAEQHSVLYFCSEESLEQVKSRAERVTKNNSSLHNVLFSDQAQIVSIIASAQHTKPDLIIIDSSQNCYFSTSHTYPGTVSQLRETSFALMRLAKEHTIAIIITCHITKEGHMAGPKTLEHMVDGVFYLQGEDRWDTRVLRSVKNRFGPINELGFFLMTQEGLQEMPHINQYLLEEASNAPGSVLISCLEGSRPLLLEIQALVVPTKFQVAQRIVTGLDHKRVVLIAAIIEKYLHIKLSAHDIFVKISGGIKINESAADLALALALLSSYFQQALPEKSMALGELSLTGSIKPINSVDTHIKEAQKFGITTIFTAQSQKTELTTASYASTKLKNIYQLLTLF